MGTIKFFNRDGLCGLENSENLDSQEKIIAAMKKYCATSISDEYNAIFTLKTDDEGTFYLENQSQGKPREDKNTEKAPDGKTFVYRAIEKDKIELYKSNPEQIPDISGQYFKNLNKEKANGVYTEREYNEEESYLHFFLTKEDASTYAKGLISSLSKDISVAKFVFDTELIENTTEEANYEIDNGHFSKPEIEVRKECAIPLSKYSPEENFVGVIEELEYKQVAAENHGCSFLDSVFK